MSAAPNRAETVAENAFLRLDPRHVIALRALADKGLLDLETTSVGVPATLAEHEAVRDRFLYLVKASAPGGFA